jgi:hypothetical protein
MIPFKDEYLESLVQTDIPYFNRLKEDKVSSQSIMSTYLTTLILRNDERIDSNKPCIALCLKGGNIVEAYRIKVPTDVDKSTSRYINSKTSVTPLSSLESELKQFFILKAPPCDGMIVQFYQDGAHEILVKNGWTYNEKSMSNSDWLYADGTVKKTFGSNWGSEIMGSIGNALATQGNMSWVGTGK